MSAEVAARRRLRRFLLVAGAFVLEWLSAHTHRRSLRYRTAGLHLRRDARPLGVPGGPAPLAARVRPRAPARALPRQGAHLQRLPAQGRPAPTPTAAARSSGRSIPGRTPRPGASTAPSRCCMVALAAARPRRRAARATTRPPEAALLLGALLARRWPRPLAGARPPRAPGGLPRAGPSHGLRLAAGVRDGWTLIRYLHIVALAFFVGGQLMLVIAVVPAVRGEGNDAATLRGIVRRFGAGSAVALAVLVATGVAMASHLQRWQDGRITAQAGAHRARSGAHRIPCDH